MISIELRELALRREVKVIRFESLNEQMLEGIKNIYFVSNDDRGYMRTQGVERKTTIIIVSGNYGESRFNFDKLRQILLDYKTEEAKFIVHELRVVIDS